MEKTLELPEEPVEKIDVFAFEFPELNPFILNTRVGKKRVDLFNYRYPSTQGECKGVVVHFHGLGGYTGHLAFMAKEYADRGFDFVGFDQRGHGRSNGLTTYFPDFEEVLEDSYLFARQVKLAYPGKNVYAAGSSMGGLVSLSLAQRYPELFSALVLTAPLIDSPILQSKKFMCFLGCMGKIVPTKRINIP